MKTFRDRVQWAGWLKPPVYPGDEAKTQQAFVLHVVIWVAFLAGLGVAIADFLSGYYVSLTPLAIASGILVFIYGLNRSGRVKLAGSLIVIVLTIVTAIITMAGQGIHDIGILMFPIILIVVVLTLDSRWILAAYLVVIAAVAVVVFGEIQGLYLADLENLAARPGDFFVVFILLTMMTVGLLFIAGATRQNLEKYRQAAQALQRSEARWRSLTEASPDLVLGVDVNGVILQTNRKAPRPEAHLVGRNIREFLLQNQDTLADEMLSRVVKTGERSQYDGKIKTLDGKEKYYSIRIGPILDDGRVTGLVLTATDIEDRIEAEMALRRRSDQFANLSRLGTSIANMHAEDSILDILLEHVLQILPVDVFFVALYSSQTQQVKFPLIYSEGVRGSETASYLGEGTWIYDAFTNHQPMLINRSSDEIQTDLEGINGTADEDPLSRVAASVMIAPMSIGTGITGVLAAHSFTAHAFQQEHLDYLVGAAGRTAVALANAQLVASLRKRSEQFSSLTQIGEAILALRSETVLMDEILVQLKRVFPLDAFYVGLVNIEKQTISFPILFDNGRKWETSELKINENGLIHQVVHKRQALLINRTPEQVAAEDNSLRLGDESRASASLAFVPLMDGANVVGVVSIQSYQYNAYDNESIEFLKIAAGQVAIALSNVRMFDELNQTTARLAALNRIGIAVSSLKERENLLELIFTHIQPMILFDYFSIGIYDPETGWIEYPWIYDNGQRWKKEPGLLPRHSWTYSVVTSGKPLLLNRTPDEIAADQHDQALMVGDETQVSASVMIAPLVLGVRVTGAVAAHSYALNAYTPDHLEFLVSVANQLAIAIENNRLLDTLHRRSSQLATLNQIAMAVTSLQPPQDLFRHMLQYLMQAIPLDVFFVGIFDPVTRQLSFPISYDSEQFWDEPAVHIGENPILDRVVEGGESVMVHRTAEELNSEAVEVRYGDRSKVSCSLILVPMQIGSRVIGVLSTQSYRMNIYTQEHIEFLQGAANQLAISFENARLFESLTRRTEQLATLNNIANAISSLQDPDRVLDIVLEQMRNALPLDVFYIALYDEQTKTNSFPLMFDSGKKWQEGEAAVAPDSWIDQVLSTGKPMLLNRTPEEIAGDAELPEDTFLGDKSKSSVSVMITPLHAGYRVIGLVSAQSYSANVYTQDHLDFLTAASYQIATAIENSRLYGALQNELVERLRSEQALRQSETRLRAIIEHIPYDMWLCDKKGRYTLQSALSIQGIGDIRGKLPQELELPQAVKTQWVSQHVRVLGGEAIVEEGQWTVDGELRDRITMLTPILDGEQVMGYVGLNIDITERKRYEESQRRFVERLEILHEIDRAILTADEPQDIARAVISRLSALIPSDLQTVLLLDRSAHAVLLAIQMGGEIQDENNLEFCDYFSDLNFSSLEGENVQVAGDLADWGPILTADCRQRLEERGYRSGMIAALTQREELLGAVIVLSTRGEAFTREHREIVSEASGSLSIALSQSQLYADIHNLNLELERRVLQRTAELEAANRDLEAFSYSVSHDLRAPLRGIAGYVTILQEEYGDQLDSEARNYMGRIRFSAQRMGILIDDLLTFSRVGRQSLQIQQFSTKNLVQDVIQELMQDQDASRVTFEIGALPKITADRSLVRQVFKNLIENALKYSRSVPVAQIQIACKDLGDEYRFMVKDNGVGFDMKYANKLFGVFERLHNSREFEGTGVGLAIVKQIVQRHGGRVWAESEPEQGAAFYLTFPKENLYAAE